MFIKEKEKNLWEAGNNARPEAAMVFLLLFSVNKTSLHINMGILHETLTVHMSPNNEKLDSLTRVYEPHSKESWEFEQFE